MEKQLFSSLNEFEIDQVCGVLTDNNIPFIRKDAGSGAYMDVVMGQSMQEKVIYVSEEDFEKASDLIAFLVNTDVTDVVEETEKNSEDSIGEEDIKKYSIIRRLFGFLIIGIPIIIGIMIIIILSSMKDM